MLFYAEMMSDTRIKMPTTSKLHRDKRLYTVPGLKRSHGNNNNNKNNTINNESASNVNGFAYFTCGGLYMD